MDAIAFASRAHKSQKRRDGKTPYVSHVFRVAMTLAQLFAVKDPDILTMAVLHDTLEDTDTDFEDLEKRYGRRIAEGVFLLSKDKRLPEIEREKVYCRQLKSAPAEVKLVKLADIHDNLLDVKAIGRAKTQRFTQKARAYLAVIAKDKSPLLKQPLRQVRRLIGIHA